jgi:hypothetical protein
MAVPSFVPPLELSNLFQEKYEHYLINQLHPLKQSVVCCAHMVLCHYLSNTP